jgi:hypothetical protein
METPSVPVQEERLAILLLDAFKMVRSAVATSADQILDAE